MKMPAEAAVMVTVAMPIMVMKAWVEKLAVKAEEVASALMADPARTKQVAKTGSKDAAREILWACWSCR
jgi:hypothetical protein